MTGESHKEKGRSWPNLFFSITKNYGFCPMRRYYGPEKNYHSFSMPCFSAIILFSGIILDFISALTSVFITGIILTFVVSGYWVYRIFKRLKRKNILLTEIISSTQDGIALLDDRYRYRFVNKTYERLFRKKSEEIIGKTVSDCFGEAFFLEYVKPHFDRCLDGETVRYMDWVDYGEAGRHFVELTFTPFQDENKVIKGIVIHNRMITDQMTTRKLLYERGINLDVFLDMIGIPVALANNEGNLIAVNQYFCHMTQYAQEELTGTSFLNLIHPEDRKKIKTEMDHLITGKISNMRCETRINDHEGSSVWLDLSLSAIRDPNLHLTGFVVAGEVITERKRLMNDLKEIQRQQETLIRNLPGIVYRCKFEPERTVEFISESVLQLTGFPAEWFHDKRIPNLSAVIYPADRNMVAETIQNAMNQKQIYSINYRIVTKGGDIRWIWDQGLGIEESSGIFTALEGYISDVTDQVMAQNKIHAAGQQLWAVIKASLDAIIVVDENANVILWNPAAQNLFQYTENEILNRPLSGLLRKNEDKNLPDSQENCCTLIQENRIEKNFRTEQICVRKDGTYFTGELSIAEADETQKRFVVVFIRDITEQKRHEMIMASRFRLLNYAPEHSLEELLKATIEEAEKITGSHVGFYHFYDADKNLIQLKAWSSETLRQCSVNDYRSEYSIEKAGIWLDCIFQGRPVIYNNYGELSHRKGTPEGHVVVQRLLCVPVARAGKIMAVLGVGNKNSDYIAEDVLTVASLADLCWDIVLNKRAEKKLKESEEYHRHIVEMANEGICTLNENCEIVYVNDKLASMLGYKPEEMFGIKIHEFMIESEPLDHCLPMEKSKSSRGRFEQCFLTKDGQTKWLIVSITPFQDVSGHFKGCVAMLMDITEKKEVETRLRLMADLLSIIPASVTIHDLQGKMLYFNSKTLEYHGYTEEEFSNLNMKQLDIPESAELIESRMQMLVEQGEASFEVGHYRKDRTVIDLLVNAKLTEWENKKAILSVATDISYQKQLESALKTSEATLKSIFKVAPIGLGMIKNGIIIWINDSMSRMTGYSIEELCDQSLRILYENEDEFRRIGNDQHQPIDQYGIDIIETQWKHKNGTIMNILLGVSIIDPQQQEKSVVLTALDITDRVRAEKALKESEEKLRRFSRGLEASNEELRQFAYIVSHDLKSPLINLKGYADELKQECKMLSEKIFSHVDDKTIPESIRTSLSVNIPEALYFIESSTMFIDKFIKKMLILARMGYREMQYENLNLNEIVCSIISTLQMLIREKQAIIHVQPMTPIIADRLAIEQIWSNLINNALLYSHPDRPCNITIGSEQKENETRMFISDNGRGIDKEDAQKIFLPFRRGKWTDIPGEGMGLAYVQTLVRRMGGEIWCEPNPDGGSIFYFTIPQKPERNTVCD